MKSFLKKLSSLQITITCLVLSMVLIFFGTLGQVSLGIHGATREYFYTFLVYWNIPNTQIAIPYMPGGYLIGGVLLVNLTAGLFFKFKYSWSKVGVLCIHSGVISLLLGEFIASVAQVESAMTLDEGATRNYSENQRVSELAIVDQNFSEEDSRVYAVPQRMLEREQEVRIDELPFTISVSVFAKNSNIFQRQGATPSEAMLANDGIGAQNYAMPVPVTGKMDEINRPAGLVTLFDENGAVLGTWLTTVGWPEQLFNYGGKTYSVALRFRRSYYPFAIKLIDFSHDRYLGTNIPKNFSSLIELKDMDSGEDREYLIYMNHPLRHEGLTFFQASFLPGDKTSILQVVSNPGRHLPYISTILISIGLLYQFTHSLLRFTSRRKRSS